MQLPRAQMPIKTTAEVTLTAEEARLAATELRAKDLKGHQVHTLSSVIGERYSYSNYVVDPVGRVGLSLSESWRLSLSLSTNVWLLSKARKSKSKMLRAPSCLAI